MTEVNLDVAVVEVDIYVSPATVELTVAPVVIDLDLGLTSVIELDVTPVPTVDLTVAPVVVDLFFSPPPVVNITVSGGGGGGGGGGGTGIEVAYRFYQPSASTIWTVVHPLTFQPNVTVVDSTGVEVWPGEVRYPNSQTVQLIFSAALGGEAYLS